MKREGKLVQKLFRGAKSVPKRRSPVKAVNLHNNGIHKATNIKWHETMVSRDDKELLLGQKGCILWFTGLSASGKSTVACTLEHLLNSLGHYTVLLDGDNIRHGLNADLGFSAEDRAENIRRIGEVAKVMADNGVITLTSFISPYRSDRDRVRERMSGGTFLEIYMKIPIEICEQRDPKGLYKKAREGKIKNFTGIDDPYEEPEHPEIILEPYEADGSHRSPDAMAEQVMSYLRSHGYLQDPRLHSTTALEALENMDALELQKGLVNGTGEENGTRRKDIMNRFVYRI